MGTEAGPTGLLGAKDCIPSGSVISTFGQVGVQETLPY